MSKIEIVSYTWFIHMNDDDSIGHTKLPRLLLGPHTQKIDISPVFFREEAKKRYTWSVWGQKQVGFEIK